MARKLLAVVAPLLGVALTLASEFLLMRMTAQSELMEDPLQRNLAILGTLVAGVLLLVGSVYICTRLAALLFSREAPAEKPGGEHGPR